MRGPGYRERWSARAAPAGRRLAVPALLTACALIGLAPAAWAAPAEPQTLCTITDPKLAELSGMVVDEAGAIWAMDDGGRRIALHRLDPRNCRIVETRTAPVDPYDAEDLALGPDGTFWVADTGDNRKARESIAVIAVPRGAGGPRLYRLTYPDGPHDAEALLVGADGMPVVVTKEVLGGAGVYRPAAPLREPGPTPLIRVGTVVLPRSDTIGGPVGAVGAYTVTGAAQSRDRSVVALRTYTDAWLFRVPQGGDVGAAFDGIPVRVPLPDEPQGEAIAFRADGTLLSGSELRVRAGELRAVPDAVALAAAARPDGAAGTGQADGGAVQAGAGSADPQAAGETPALPEPGPEWGPAAIGGGIAVAALASLAGGLALHNRRRS